MQTAYRSEPYWAQQERLSAYLPAPLIAEWARQPERPPPWGSWLTGSLMFCDISGFTAMSEDLARLGKEGAELMAGILNRFFERMIAIADDWGGMQIKFGGDAMLLLFTDDGHADRAAAAGLEMQAAMAAFRRVRAGRDNYRLRMRIAIHSGRFFGASVGQPEGILHYLLVGRDVNRTAAIEGAGEPGQVVMSVDAARQVGPGCHLTPAKNGVWRLRRMEQMPLPRRRPRPLAAPGGVLQRYLLPPFQDGHAFSPSGEQRRVTAVFINILGVSEILARDGEAQALAQMDAYVRLLVGCLEGNGGFLAGSDLASEGDKLICLFGAPLSVEQGEAAALRAMLELDSQLPAAGIRLRHRIGISSGHVFAGEIGSSSRREYTVIGDSVNLAARLMAAARPGDIYISQPTMDRAGSGFDVQRLRPLRVKGKAEPVPVLRLRGRQADAGVAPGVASPLVGRRVELETLQRLAESASSDGQGGWAYVWGEPGIGKSRLTAELRAGLRAKGWQEFIASCQLQTSKTPFAAWREPLRALTGITSADSGEAAAHKVRVSVADAVPQMAGFGSLLGELLAVPMEEDSSLGSLEPRERRNYLTSIVCGLLAAAGGARPLLLLFEDTHWADSSSLELLAAVLASGETRILSVITSREPEPPPELRARSSPAVVRLRELPREDAAQLLASSAAALSQGQLARILARAQGNPLFLQEIARIGLQRGESLPETVNDVILARLDRLPTEEKNVMRWASVIGPSFSLEALNALTAGVLDESRVERALMSLRDLGFTRDEGQETRSWAFSHILTREVAYETLPYAERRRLHLLHHYERAADERKAVRYAAMSGDRAAAVFATAEAMEYYNRSLAGLAALQKGYEADHSMVLERLGDCLDTAGRHQEAAEMFTGALAQWRAGRRRGRLLAAAAVPRAREADLCRKVAVSCERRSDYDDSLNWVNEALRFLPSRPGLVGARVYATKSLALFRKGLYEHAVLWGRRGLGIAARSRDMRLLAYAHHILAGSYMELGKLRQALDHDRLSARLYHELGDLPGQARANSNLGLSYQMLGVLDAAAYHYEIALKADERIGNMSHASIVRNNIGEVLLLQGRLDEAEAHLNEVTGAHRRGIARTALAGLAEVNLARSRLRADDLAGAGRHVRRGLRLLRSVGAEGLIADAQLQQIELQLAAGRARPARRESSRMLEELRQIASKVLESRAERLLGRAEAALGKTEAGIRHLRESIVIARRSGAGYEEALSLIELGRALKAFGRTSGRATRALRRAAAILSAMGAAPDLREAETLLAGAPCYGGAPVEP